MISLLGWVPRWRTAVLAAALLVAVGFAVLAHTGGSDGVEDLIAGLNLLLAFALLTLGVVADRTSHPARLVARPELPAFEIPPDPGVVLRTAGFTVMIVMWIGSLVRDVAAGDDLGFWQFFPVVFVGLLPFLWRSALGPFGVRLRPDGVVDRHVFGTLFVPWEALATPYPFAHDRKQATLSLAHPELVRRRGLRHGRSVSLPTGSVNAELLARAIHEYANRPELRTAIGSETELVRFLRIPQIMALTKNP